MASARNRLVNPRLAVDEDEARHPLARELCKPKSGQVFTVRNQEYILGGKIGNGAAGLVRKASPKDSNILYAIKLLAPDPKYIEENAFDDVARRFKREGERGVHLKHEHLIEIKAYCDNENGASFTSEAPTNPFILMEYVDGKTLESYILKEKNIEGKFDVSAQRLNIAIQLTSALEYLHKRKLIHRDVKPSNIFLLNRPKNSYRHVNLGDFGVMKWGDFQASVATGTLTTLGQKGLGTLKYMSPEQALRPENVKSSADVYSLGITLFELFTGQILASAHHVYEISNARRARGTTASRFYDINCKLDQEDEGIASLILDMFLAASGRPKVKEVMGRLKWEYDRRFQRSWQGDLYS